MPPLLAQVDIPAVTGFVRDKVVNTFVFDATNGIGVAAIEALTMDIAAFYNNADVQPSLGAYMGSSRTRAVQACGIRYYDLTGHLNGTPHGSPIFERAFTLAAAAQASEFPQEVALAVTLHGFNRDIQPVEAPDDLDADTGPERPRQRRTGKVYLGPFHDNAGDMATGVNRPEADLINSALNACVRLRNQAANEGNIWSVWSRANQSLYSVEFASVDNAWDTQRRRGVGPTARTLRDLVV